MTRGKISKAGLTCAGLFLSLFAVVFFYGYLGCAGDGGGFLILPFTYPCYLMIPQHFWESHGSAVWLLAVLINAALIYFLFGGALALFRKK
jgi:hypothetical protein